MFEELDKVILTHDIKEYNLKEGDRGTIVHVYGKGEGYEVEFFNVKGETIAVLTLVSHDLRLYMNKDEYVSHWFNAPISFETVSSMTLDTSIGRNVVRIETETLKSKADTEEFRYPTAII